MATLSYGSSGDEVKKLQTLLNQQGYSLDVDGNFGAQTQSAVKSYQQKNGLSSDGIVGNNTWGTLSGKTGTSSTGYTKPTATSASKAVSQWEASKPAAYKNTYSSQIDALLKQILNGKKFSYDVNTDALYQQYKQQYVKQGQQAMQDTIGQSAALTGGYGSSYATTAGSQAYQSYLDQLNNMVPQLEQNAYAKYQNDQQALRNNLATYMQQDDSLYNRYRDTVADYWTQGDYLTQKEDVLYNRDWDKTLFEYQKQQDAKTSSGGSSGRSSGRSSNSKSSGSVATYDENKVKSWIDNGNYEAVAKAYYVYNPNATKSDLVDMFSQYMDYDEAKSVVDKLLGTTNTTVSKSTKTGNGMIQEAK